MAASLGEKDKEWLEKRVAYIKGLKTPIEQQRLLVELVEKQERTPNDDHLLAALIKAEKAAARLLTARAAANKVLNAEADAARRVRSHELFRAAGLLILAGLVDSKTGKPVWDRMELLGALIELAECPHAEDERRGWRVRGDALMASRG